MRTIPVVIQNLYRKYQNQEEGRQKPKSPKQDRGSPGDQVQGERAHEEGRAARTPQLGAGPGVWGSASIHWFFWLQEPGEKLSSASIQVSKVQKIPC